MAAFNGKVTVKIGGKKRLLRFGTNQTAILTDLYDVPLEDFTEEFSQGKMTIGKTRDMIYSALVAGCLSQGKEADFTQYQVGDWIDEMSQDDLDLIYKTAYTRGEAKKKQPSAGKKS